MRVFGLSAGGDDESLRPHRDRINISRLSSTSILIASARPWIPEDEGVHIDDIAKRSYIRWMTREKYHNRAEKVGTSLSVTYFRRD